MPRPVMLCCSSSVLCYAVLQQETLCYVMSCYAQWLCCAATGVVMPYHAVLCHAVPCCDMLCCEVLCCAAAGDIMLCKGL